MVSGLQVVDMWLLVDLASPLGVSVVLYWWLGNRVPGVHG
jgi:hypothetical protein